MPNKSEPGYVLVKERIPYQGKGVDALMGALRKILTDNKYTQKILMEVGEPHIYIEKLVPEADAQEYETVRINTHGAIRNMPMEEYQTDDGVSPAHQLWEMFSIIHKEGFEVCRIVSGSKNKFAQWLKVRIPQTDQRVFGVPLEVIGDIPDDVFIVCGAKHREAEPDEITMSVKGTT